jgi:hypothetical protein
MSVIPPRNAFTTVSEIKEEEYFVVDNTLYQMYHGQVRQVQIMEANLFSSPEMPKEQMVIRLTEP